MNGLRSDKRARTRMISSMIVLALARSSSVPVKRIWLSLMTIALTPLCSTISFFLHPFFPMTCPTLSMDICITSSWSLCAALLFKLKLGSPCLLRLLGLPVLESFPTCDSLDMTN